MGTADYSGVARRPQRLVSRMPSKIIFGTTVSVCPDSGMKNAESRVRVDVKRAAVKTDIELRRDVERALEWEPSIDAREIAVTVKNGVVTLTGHVCSCAEKCAAERVAK